jgi:hypothetical protein
MVFHLLLTGEWGILASVTDVNKLRGNCMSGQVNGRIFSVPALDDFRFSISVVKYKVLVITRISQGALTCPKSATWDRRPYFYCEGRHAMDFFRLKNLTVSSGFEPVISGTRGQNANH